jgi:hypothetical protein
MKKSELKQLIKEELSYESLRSDIYKAIDKYMKENPSTDRKTLFSDVALILDDMVTQLKNLSK